MNSKTEVVLALLVVCVLYACGGGVHPGGGAKKIGSTISPQEAARLCTLEASCIGMTGASCGTNTVSSVTFGGNSTNITEDPSYVDRVFSCSDAFMGCPGLVQCLLLDHGADYCTAHHGQSCDGDIAVQCSSGSTPPESVKNCASTSQHCAQITISGEGPAAGCTTGVSCNPSTFTERCEGSYRVSCDSVLKQETRDDCTGAYPDGICVLQSDTGTGGAHAHCAPNGPSCSPDGSTKCEDEFHLLTCVQGHQQREDCQLVQSTCQAVGSGAHCQTGATECATDSPNRCDGTKLLVCVNGAYVATDCTSIGFAACTTSAEGALCTH